jgi:hypothetical protein
VTDTPTGMFYVKKKESHSSTTVLFMNALFVMTSKSILTKN